MSDNSKLYYKTCREQAGLTQEQAVVLLNIPEVATLSRYENGRATVPPDILASMVKVYRTPSLANWHFRYIAPGLEQCLPNVVELRTDGDMFLQIELAADSISDARMSVKATLRDGMISDEEAEMLRASALTLREAADKILSAAAYLEGRKADE